MDTPVPRTDVAVSLARARALDALAGSEGVVIGVAIDHRDALQRVLQRRGLQLSDKELGAFKARVTDALAPPATVVLLDVEHGVGPAIATGALPGHVALCVPLEAQGYGDAASVEETSFLPGWSPARARALGACACKLLLPYRVDIADQERLLVERSVPLLERLAIIARTYATPWRTRVPSVPTPPSGWHST